MWVPQGEPEGESENLKEAGTVEYSVVFVSLKTLTGIRDGWKAFIALKFSLDSG